MLGRRFFLLRIPADMIDMQMGAEYEIDCRGIDAGHIQAEW
jgi:hypothetical protein